MTVTFSDRVDAGRQLAARLRADDHGRDAVVVGLPRGGVTVAAEVASGLGAPLDVIVVRKLGVPSQPELAMGAIGEDGVRLLNDDVAAQTGVGSGAVAEVEARERVVLDRRVRQYREVRPMVPVAGRTVIVVDDGFATGATARAACRVARQRRAARVVLAVPVAPPGWDERVGDDADECIAVATPTPFWAVGHWYQDFEQVSDDTVIELLRRAADADTTEDHAP